MVDQPIGWSVRILLINDKLLSIREWFMPCADNTLHGMATRKSPPPLRATFGLNVRIERIRNRKTLEVLADELGTTASFLSRVERGLVAPSLDFVERVTKALNVSAATLMTEHRPEPPAMPR
jgi:ribosome-binding protein aMBF1 (putative translation factor)